MLRDLTLQRTEGEGYARRETECYYVANLTPGDTYDEIKAEIEKKFSCNVHFMSPELRDLKIQGALVTFRIVYPSTD